MAAVPAGAGEGDVAVIAAAAAEPGMPLRGTVGRATAAPEAFTPGAAASPGSGCSTLPPWAPPVVFVAVAVAVAAIEEGFSPAGMAAPALAPRWCFEPYRLPGRPPYGPAEPLAAAAALAVVTAAAAPGEVVPFAAVEVAVALEVREGEAVALEAGGEEAVADGAGEGEAEADWAVAAP